MKLVLKYLNPFIVAICLLLLLGQAVSDLSLPNLMSDIVNTGIQRNGVEENSPKIISESSFNMLLSLTDDNGRSLMQSSYTLSEPGSEFSVKNEKDFPYAKSQNVYVLTETNAERLAATEKVFGIAAYSMLQNTRLSASADSMIYSQIGGAFTQRIYTELGADLASFQQRYIITKGVQMLLVALAGVAASVLTAFFASRTAASVAKRLRRDVFAKVESFSLNEFDKFSTASLITRTTNDIQQVQTLIVMGLRMMCYAPIMGIGGIFMAVNKSLSMSWIIAVAVIFLIGIIMVLYSLVMPKFRMMQKLTDRLNLVSRENLAGMMVIRAFGNQRYEEKRFEKATEDLRNTERFTQRAMAFMMPTMGLIMSFVSLTIIWVGAHAIEQSTLQIGDMMAFVQYAMQIIMSFLMISMMFIMIPRASVSATRLAEVLKTEPGIKDPESAVHFPKNIKGTVKFSNVTFRYNGAETDVLSNISFTAKNGETTAFIGSTGSGKSTLINLVPRFYDVTGGSIEIDGIDIRNVSQHELRAAIGYIPQKGVLFSGDVKSNLLMSKEDANTDQMLKSLEVAQAKDFAEPDMSISQGGGNVSGGQKQRLSIARALIKKPPIYIFDDSFSALDYKTDAVLRRALKDYTNNATLLIVAQRVSTVMNAEQIIVLDEGKIVGKGTHIELLKSCAEYREIAESQLSMSAEQMTGHDSFGGDV